MSLNAMNPIFALYLCNFTKLVLIDNLINCQMLPLSNFIDWKHVCIFMNNAVANPLQRPSPLQEGEGRAIARLKF